MGTATAVLKTDSGSPETIAGCDLDAVAFADSRCLVAAAEHFSPVIDVFRRIGNDDRKTGSSRRGMDADDLLLGSGHKSQRVRISQIRFLRERKLLKLLRIGNMCDPGLLELLSIETSGSDQRVDAVIDLCELSLIDSHNKNSFIIILYVRRSDAFRRDGILLTHSFAE